MPSRLIRYLYSACRSIGTYVGVRVRVRVRVRLRVRVRVTSENSIVMPIRPPSQMVAAVRGRGRCRCRGRGRTCAS